MLTGDHKSSAWRVANAVGINEVHCSLKPEDKLNHVTNIPRNTGDFQPISQLIYKSCYLYALSCTEWRHQTEPH